MTIHDPRPLENADMTRLRGEIHEIMTAYVQAVADRYARLASDLRNLSPLATYSQIERLRVDAAADIAELDVRKDSALFDADVLYEIRSEGRNDD